MERKELEGQILVPFRTFISAELSWANRRWNVNAFLDSGSVDCVVDATWARKHRLPIRPLPQAQPILALDGRPLGSGLWEIMHLSILTGGHSEKI